MVFGAGECMLDLRGGTNAEHAPQIDFFERIFAPIARKHLGLHVESQILRRGYYPKGGGEVFIRTSPCEYLNSVDLVEFGTLVSFSFILYSNHDFFMGKGS